MDLPARFDWSIMGCTIRRRALMNLEKQKRGERQLDANGPFRGRGKLYVR